MNIHPDRLYSKRAAARLLGIGDAAIAAGIQNGTFVLRTPPGNRHPRITGRSLLAFLNEPEPVPIVVPAEPREVSRRRYERTVNKLLGLHG